MKTKLLTPFQRIRLARAATLGLAAALGACEAAEPDVPAAVLAERRAAAQTACIAERVATEAAENLQVLSAGAALPGAGKAAHQFGETFARYAGLRAAAAAYQDSAVNLSESAADSARYAALAASVATLPPEPGTVEANAAAAFAQQVAAVRAVPNHPCSWEP